MINQLIDLWKTKDSEEKQLDREFKKAKRQGEADLYTAEESVEAAKDELEKVTSLVGKEWSSAVIVAAENNVAFHEKSVESIKRINKKYLTPDK